MTPSTTVGGVASEPADSEPADPVHASDTVLDAAPSGVEDPLHDAACPAGGAPVVLQ